MNKQIKIISLIAATGALGASLAFAQPAAGPGHHHDGASTNRMEWRKEMLQEHEKMMARMKGLDATLDKDVAQMNQAQGNARINAMAAVINDLVKEHNLLRDRMAEMHQRTMSRMQQHHQMMGGAEQGTGGKSSGGGTTPGQP